jgi:thiol-disulfide isomerase/thioredoxin
MRRLTATTTGIAAALLLAACSGATDSPEAATDTTPAPTASATADEPEPTEEPSEESTDEAGTDAADAAEPVAVPAALDFEASTVDGGTFAGASLVGQDSVLYFWAPWCTVCRGEAPSLPAVADEFAGQATFYGVAGLSPDVSAMQGFVDDTGTSSLTHIADTDGSIYTGFGISSQTTFAFVDDDGTIEIVRGPLDPDDLRQRTQALIDS